MKRAVEALDQAKRDQLIRSWAKEIKTQLDHLLPNKPGEADLRHCVEPLLDNFCREVGVPPLKHAEYSLFSGVADAVFDRFIIEYKRPTVLSPRMDLQTTAALDQLKGYLRDMAKDRDKSEHLGGAVFDGCYVIFVRYHDGRFFSETLPLPVNEHSLHQLLSWLAILASGKALTSANLSNDFAIAQPHTQQTLNALVGAINTALAQPESIVGKLFEQWKLFFSESIDYSEAFGGRKLDPLRKWVAKAGIEVKTQEEAERFFFALHTYFALLVKLLAWLALSRHIGVKMGGPSFAELAGADSETLLRKLKEMEGGGIFRAFGISNLLEGDFFSWYLHAWNPEMESAVRDLLQLLNQYEPTTLSIQPEETRDLFKKLYHYLLPREIRHNLGEYYTPDWLAQRLLNQIDNEYFTADPRKREADLRRKVKELRFLDPACGSGTFLVLVIGRMRQLNDRLMIDNVELRDAILRNVVGMDLNPLAVLTARVNYVLAISDLLGSGGEITIPVYLADSVRIPAGGKLFKARALEFPTAIGTFYVPSLLCAPRRFDRFCTALENSIDSEVSVDSFLRRVVSALDRSGIGWTEDDEELLRELYLRLLDYHKRGMNGLWARLLKNNFAPRAVGQFDYIVGNPPWVNWRNLPDMYRRSIADLWTEYNLFSLRGMDSILGKANDDISILMTYVVAHRLLKNGGRLGFVISQSLLKSAAGAGFRHFGSPPVGRRPALALQVTYVDDMVRLHPFEGATNRTAVIVMRKGKKTDYPLPYTVWFKKPGAKFEYGDSLEDVKHATRWLYFQAVPVDPHDVSSSWFTASEAVTAAFRKYSGASDYTARVGVYTGGANAIFWLEIIAKKGDGVLVVRNLSENAKTKATTVTKELESELVFPLLRGRDVNRWSAIPSAHILITHESKGRLRAMPELELERRLEHTHAYLKLFEGALRSRAAFKRYFKPEKDPFYSMFDVGEYSFSDWKVVWREMASQMTASVVGRADGKPVMPDHKLMTIGCSSEEEAHYLCAMLNCSQTVAGVAGYAIEIQMAPHILRHIRIPKFDPENKVHQRLSDLSMQAHKLVRNQEPKTKNQELTSVEAEVDRCSAQLWGLTDAELAEIQRSLKELTE